MANINVYNTNKPLAIIATFLFFELLSQPQSIMIIPVHIGMTDDIYNSPNNKHFIPIKVHHKCDNKLFLSNDFMTFIIEILCITKVQKIRDATFYNHGFYFDLQLHTSILSWLRYSDGFSELIHFLSEPVHVRNPVYLEIEFTVFILFDGADGMSGIKTSIKLGRIEFTFYPDFLELTQSSDYPVIKA